MCTCVHYIWIDVGRAHIPLVSYRRAVGRIHIIRQRQNLPLVLLVDRSVYYVIMSPTNIEMFPSNRRDVTPVVLRSTLSYVMVINDIAGPSTLQISLTRQFFPSVCAPAPLFGCMSLQLACHGSVPPHRTSRIAGRRHFGSGLQFRWAPLQQGITLKNPLMMKITYYATGE